MGVASREVWEVLETKRKYWCKALSESAWGTNLWVMFNIFDHFSFWIDFTLSDTLLSSLLSLLFFDIPLIDVVPWGLAWNVEVPTAEELSRGVLVRLERKTVREALIEWLRRYYEIALGLSPEEVEERVSRLSLELEAILKVPEEAITKVFKPEVSAMVLETRPRKAVYGVTRYDESYYDPQAVREFLRSTFEAWMQKRGSYDEVRLRLRTLAKTLNMYEGVVEDIFNRLSMFDSIKESCLTWDYGWWDRTLWGPEEYGSPPEPVVEVTDFYGRKVRLEYKTLFDAQGSGWWDFSHWDQFYWTPTEIEAVPIYSIFEDLKDSYLSVLRDAMVLNARSRIVTTATAVANYQTFEAMRSPMKSPRTETYALPYSMRLRLERIVESVVTKLIPNIDTYRLRLYKTAVLELFGSLSSPHRWGDEAVRAMSDEELRNYWIGKWGSDGLDPNVLSILYDQVMRTIRAFRNVRVKDRLRFLRYRLRR